VRTSFHHQSEAQPPNGTLTAATSPDTPSYMASQAVGSPMIGCPSPLPAAGVSLTHVAPTAAHPQEGSVLIENRRQSSCADEVIEGGAAAFITLLGVAVCGPPRRATARNVLRDLNSVPVLVEGKGGGTSQRQRSSSAMCDYSLHHVKSRPAKVGDKLRTVNFNTGTRGFAAPEDSTTAVCVLPGTELAFSEEVKCAPAAFGFSSWRTKTVNFRTAIFRQVNKDVPRVHHDALEFPDGTCVLLTELREGQEATVLQLPAQPKTPAEEAAQKRVTYVG